MRRTWWPATAAVAVLLLAGCAGSTDPGTQVEQDAPATESSPAMEPITSVDDLTGTVWRGDDTDGDRHTFTFGETLLTHDSYGTKQEVSWNVEGDTVTFRISFGPGDALDFTTTVDADTQTMTAHGVDPEDPTDELTIELERLR